MRRYGAALFGSVGANSCCMVTKQPSLTLTVELIKTTSLTITWTSQTSMSDQTYANSCIMYGILSQCRIADVGTLSRSFSHLQQRHSQVMDNTTSDAFGNSWSFYRHGMGKHPKRRALMRARPFRRRSWRRSATTNQLLDASFKLWWQHISIQD